MSDLRVVWQGPSPWTIGRCWRCKQPIHYLGAETIVWDGDAGRSYHTECWETPSLPRGATT